ncbi:MAG: hypothetical protein ABSG97_10800 [Sedimentisphaerales bacterium]|jgi:hypothetical protein
MLKVFTALPWPDSSKPQLNRKPAGYLKPIADAIEISRGEQGLEVVAGVKKTEDERFTFVH